MTEDIIIIIVFGLIFAFFLIATINTPKAWDEWLKKIEEFKKERQKGEQNDNF